MPYHKDALTASLARELISIACHEVSRYDRTASRESPVFASH